jgi:hypothetical protein
MRNEQIEQHIQETAETYGLKPEEVSVIDLEALPKQNHHFVQRGIRFVCDSPAHPRHEFIARQPM